MSARVTMKFSTLNQAHDTTFRRGLDEWKRARFKDYAERLVAARRDCRSQTTPGRVTMTPIKD